MKVVDKRMFTPDGALRESSAEDEAPPKEAQDSDISEFVDSPEVPEIPGETLSDQNDRNDEPTMEGRPGRPESAASKEVPADSDHGAPGFLELVALLAEPTALYLGDVPMPDGKSAQDLSLARYHIDLLEVVRQKSEGNLSSDEAAFLSDVLYRLRMRYVQKKGSP